MWLININFSPTMSLQKKKVRTLQKLCCWRRLVDLSKRESQSVKCKHFQWQHGLFRLNQAVANITQRLDSTTTTVIVEVKLRYIHADRFCRWFHYLASLIPPTGWVMAVLYCWFFHTQTSQGCNIWTVLPLTLYYHYITMKDKLFYKGCKNKILFLKLLCILLA